MNDFSSRRRSRGAARSVLAVVLMVALIAAAVFGYLAWREAFADTSPVDVTIDEANDVLARIEGEVTPEGSPAPAQTAAAVETVERATQAVARVTEQQGGIDQRLAAAEQRLARLDVQAQAAAGNAARAEGLLIALATRRTVEKGAELGFLADQLRLRFGDAKPNAVRTITSVSRDPVTLDRLIARLEGLGPDLQQSSEAPSLDTIRRELGSLFVIRRESAPSPQPLRRMERARLFLESGRYESAIEEVQNMPGADNAEGWIADVRRYAAVQRALDLIETSAILEPQLLRDGTGNRIGGSLEPANP
ncbi:hypothetical protein [Altererythrobacter sp. MTPC7]|uniref:hypothetical protein n=1 Tax=Altererythrobacter sp. MTPC7 TaxID=3056567 RepID=UPI0036F39CB8